MKSMNQAKLDRQLFMVMLLIALSLLMVGCSRNGDSESASASGKTYKVSSTLREFYITIGGKDLLGPAISKQIEIQASQCQYTANALICMNPMLTGDERFSLFPLGNDLNLREDPGESAGEGSLIINGFTIYEEFIPLYQKLSETTNAGYPISQVHLNYARDRIEQFFENVGFYRNFSDPPGTIKLLAYGAEHCKKDCSYRAVSEASLSNPSVPNSDQSLLEELESISEVAPFGKSLTQPAPAADGNEEQVYEGIVIYRDIHNGVVRLRPLAILVGMLTTESGEKMYGSENGVVFYAVRETLGYHVPILFDQFITAHGGIVVSGDPIAEVIEYQPGIFRQCFTNYCLDYTPVAPKKQQVTVASLGSQYLLLQPDILIVQPTAEPSPQTLALQVNAQFNPLYTAEAQQISMVVLNTEDQSPVPGVEADLILNLPGGSTYTAALPATQSDGSSLLVLPVMKKIPNGTILSYQVCLKNVLQENICQSGTYLVWKNP